LLISTHTISIQHLSSFTLLLSRLSSVI